MTERRRRGPVELATARTLKSIEQVSPAHEGLSASALVLARALDDGAGLATAAVARELRATLMALTEGIQGGDTDPAAEFFARMSAPVEYAPEG